MNTESPGMNDDEIFRLIRKCNKGEEIPLMDYYYLKRTGYIYDLVTKNNAPLKYIFTQKAMRIIEYLSI